MTDPCLVAHSASVHPLRGFIHVDSCPGVVPLIAEMPGAFVATF